MSKLDELRRWLLDNLEPVGWTVEVAPILHNKNVVILQFHGWSLNVYEDGTWIVEATGGG